MAEENKKISFGFAKSIKKPTLAKQVPQEEKKVDYVKYLDEKTIKVIGEEKKKEEPLVIPLIGPNTRYNRIVNRIDADIYKSKVVSQSDAEAIKQEPKEVPNGDLTLLNNSLADVQIKTEQLNENESNTLTLEEQAAKEIIEDLNSTEKNGDKTNNFTLPLVEEQNLRGAEENTLDDYERIPVDAFGLALIRGMGWCPGKGIGKNEKLVANAIPELRPKGMGLGADRVTSQKQNSKPQKEEVELQMKKGSFIKIIVGKHSNAYGQIEGFDGDIGRLIVKMALGGHTISINECAVQVVTTAEYLKNSKVLNATKYEEYKSKEGKSKKRSTSPESLSDSDAPDRKRKRKENESKHKSRKSSKKSKSRRDTSSSGSDNDSKRKSRKRRSSSSSDTHRTKKTKKSKKHKERSKERKKDKKSRYSESPDSRKSKKHRRSRSSSRR